MLNDSKWCTNLLCLHSSLLQFTDELFAHYLWGTSFDYCFKILLFSIFPPSKTFFRFSFLSVYQTATEMFVHLPVRLSVCQTIACLNPSVRLLVCLPVRLPVCLGRWLVILAPPFRCSRTNCCRGWHAVWWWGFTRTRLIIWSNTSTNKTIYQFVNLIDNTKRPNCQMDATNGMLTN